MPEVSLRPLTNRDISISLYYYTFAAHKPGLALSPGRKVSVECPDSDNLQADGKPLPKHRRQHAPADGPTLFEGNPLAGPFTLTGLKAGDNLAIKFDKVSLTTPTGRTLLRAGHGLLPAELLSSDGQVVPHRMLNWTIDPRNGVARLANAFGKQKILVPLSPFVGCAGVCPKHGQAISSLYAGDFGGNMDLPFIRAGATLILPCSVAGGFFFVGDIHAAQGHGEVIGGGIETSGKVAFQLCRYEGKSLPFPRALDAFNVYAIASHGDLRHGVQLAVSRLVEWLAVDAKMNRFDAYALVSMTNTIIIGNAVTAPYTVAAAIPLSCLPALTRRCLAGLR